MPSYKLMPHINNESLFKKLHIKEGTEVFDSANKIIDEIKEFIIKNMSISAYFAKAHINLIGLYEGADKDCIICLVSSKDDIGDFSREMINSGNYLKGYLLYEAANHALFEASDRFSKFVRQEELKNGRKLSRRYFAGDGDIDLNMQKEIMGMLKEKEDVEAYINERNVLFPERSLLYVFVAEEAEDGCCINQDEENECERCKNYNCRYRDENEKIPC
ncbi:hypothetical protein [Sedimentibacter saalensis]|uniref:Cobalamin-dependent methionine synthase-like protein n=1 Tax=Sedimentibacter saalensis TaxID=130788 RepID=A0A562JF14_9FIRM|nr:hypothetical protein [Sedimentibacter saalensis]TWH81780.1 hypothetical protein LY60_01537 [Sedimentibacter saalensis]